MGKRYINCSACGKGSQSGGGSKVEQFVRRRGRKAGRGARVLLVNVEALVGGGHNSFDQSAGM